MRPGRVPTGSRVLEGVSPRDCTEQESDPIADRPDSVRGPSPSACGPQERARGARASLVPDHRRSTGPYQPLLGRPRAGRTCWSSRRDRVRVTAVATSRRRPRTGIASSPLRRRRRSCTRVASSATTPADRFRDASLLACDERERLARGRPGGRGSGRSEQVVSHPGATYGGLLMQPGVGGTAAVAAMEAAAAAWRDMGFRRLVYKAVPGDLPPVAVRRRPLGPARDWAPLPSARPHEPHRPARASSSSHSAAAAALRKAERPAWRWTLDRRRFRRSGRCWRTALGAPRTSLRCMLSRRWRS